MNNPDIELLLSCARTEMDLETADKIRRLLCENIEWNHLLEFARPHGILPLLYRHLRSIAPEWVPEFVLSKLQEYSEDLTHRSLLLTQELLTILDLFAAHQIHAVPFKGPVLAHLVYKNLSLRPFSDLDILLQKKDVFRARELLLSKGYGPCHDPESRLTDIQEARLQELQYCRALLKVENQFLVELHWNITPRYFSCSFDTRGLMDRARPVLLGGKEIYSLTPEDMLLVLTVHGSKHCWERLSWVCDIAELIRAYPEMDWSCVMEEAKKIGSLKMLLLGLSLARDLLGLNLPNEKWVCLSDHTIDQSVSLLVRDVGNRLLHQTRGPGVIKTLFFHLRMRERPRDRVKYLLNVTLIPSAGDYEVISLPEVLYFLYYLIKPARLLVKYGWGALRCRSAR